MRDRRALTFVALLGASALCCATLEYRIHRTGDSFYRFLVWNLILAWVPFGLALASFGVYLGRFVRFNSWDALLRPGRVAQVIRNQLENPFEHPRLVATLVVLTAFLTVAYAVLYSFAGLRLELERD